MTADHGGPTATACEGCAPVATSDPPPQHSRQLFVALHLKLTTPLPLVHVGQGSLRVLPLHDSHDLGPHGKHSILFQRCWGEAWNLPGLSQPLLCCWNRVAEPGKLPRQSVAVVVTCLRPQHVTDRNRRKFGAWPLWEQQLDPRCHMLSRSWEPCSMAALSMEL